MRLLIYTDSRGQHTPRGAPVHDVFATRVAGLPGVDATVLLCPMKWTTTLDFLDLLKTHNPCDFDHTILFTGIVDWSPRPHRSAVNDLYNNPTPLNLANTSLNTREYARKVVNNKKPSFDSVFGEPQMRDHFSRDLGVIYEDQPTANMYSLQMAERYLLPKLKAIDNLLFINSNRFVPGWDGDYTRGRPKNIGITEQYSELFRDALGPRKVVDLLEWDEATVRKLTCDGLHLTKAGSDWIFERVAKRIGSDRTRAALKTAPTAQASEKPTVQPQAPARIGLAPFSAYGRPLLDPKRLSPADRADALVQAGRKPNEKLATLIIGVRFPDEDESRVANLRFLLSWIDHYYGDLFDVLLVEQDSTSKISKIAADLPSYARYEFVYNPHHYNRGWGYNAAVQHFANTPVVALMDTDVLPGGNFLQEIIDCHSKYKAISPYSNIYFTTAAEAAAVIKTMSTSGLRREKGVRKPTTVAGGVLIAQREAFLEVAGFEQYTSYGGEDRALDVTLLNRFAANEIRSAPFVYAHLFHPSTEIVEENLQAVLGHLRENYGCTVDMNLKGEDDIHVHCVHKPRDATDEAVQLRRSAFGDLALYACGRPLTVNGLYEDFVASSREEAPPLVLEELAAYPKRELYEAPEPDAHRIAALYNKFRGKRCFIIGNGPSLNKHDLSLLQDEYVFAVNSFFYKTDETGFRPTFYVVEDNAVMKENLQRIKDYEAPYKFFPTNYAKQHPPGDNVYFFRMNRGFYEKTSPNYCIPRFSTDASDVLYCGQSVTYINLQLAYFLGFTEVYLIGMDFEYVIPPEFKRNGDLILSTGDDPNHFHSQYFGKGKTWKDPKLERVAENYRQAKIVYESVGRRIYNATIGGKLEIFPRVDYHSLFAKTGDDESGNAVVTHRAAETTKATPLISVIVPCYNVADYLEECLDSLVAQDDNNFEVVLVDDGSTDATPEIIARYCARQTNFMSVRRENGGLGAARNTGVDFCHGEFILFVDSDDFVSPKAISALRAKQVTGDYDVVTGRFVRVAEDGTVQDVVTDGLRQHEIPKESPPLSPAQKVLGAFAPSIACARLYRTSLLREHNLRFPGRLPHEDLFFTYKALGFARASAAIADEIYFYRQRESSISKTISKAHFDTLFAQWVDTDDFLAKTGAPPIDHALAARRTLIALEGFVKRARSSFPELHAYFNAELQRRRSGLHVLLSEFRQSKIAAAHVPQIAVRAIESLPIDVSIAPEYKAANVIYPHTKIDFSAYKEREKSPATDHDRRGLAQFYNAFRGKRCFILGNGPSLNKHDLSLLKDEYTFGVNSLFYKTRETGFTPTFFVVEDNLVMRENIEEIRAYDPPYKFFPAEYKNLHPADENTFFYPSNQGFYLQSSPNYCVPRFSTDATKDVFCGQTVTFANLQLAYFMGFSEVYLIGMDFHYVVPDAHSRLGTWILSTTDDPNHFHRDYFGKGKTWKDPKLERVANAYRQARLSFEAAGRKIANASIGGKLEIFERVDFASLVLARKEERARAAPPQVPKSTAAAQAAPAQPPTPAAAAPSTPRETPVTATPGQAPERPFYAEFGEHLRDRSPAAFNIVRFARRALAGVWRRRAITVPALLVLLALPLTTLLPQMAPYRVLIWGASAFLVAMATIAYVSLRFYEAIGNQISDMRDALQHIRDLEGRLTDRIGKKAGPELVSRMKAEIDTRVKSIDAVMTARTTEMRNEARALQARTAASERESGLLRAELGRHQAALHADMDAREAALREVIAELDTISRAAIAQTDASLREAIAELGASVLSEVSARDAVLESLRKEAAVLESALRTNFAPRIEDVEAAAEGLQGRLARHLEQVKALVEAGQIETRLMTEAIQAQVGQRIEEYKKTIAAQQTDLGERIDYVKETASAQQADLTKRVEELKVTAAAQQADFAKRVEEMKVATAVQHADFGKRIEEIKTAATAQQIDVAKRIEEAKATIAALQTDLGGRVENEKAATRAQLADLGKRIEDMKTSAEAQQTNLGKRIEAVKTTAEMLEKVAATTRTNVEKLSAASEFNIERLRARVASSERQLSAMRYPDTPSTLVFFGHHKCASRFFRLQVFTMIAEVTGSRTRRYEIKHPPFHYSKMDELDLVNMDFKNLGVDGRDTVWFANATERSLDKIKRSTNDWKGLRIIRDPRQVLVSNYFHHRGDHHDVAPVGWIWDQLVADKPLLRELPEEEGLLHELNSISKQVIEEQVLAKFDDARVLTIKIEDFAQNPKAHLVKISEFFGVADVAGIDLSKLGANPDSGPWQKFFTSKLRQVFKERYGQALIDLGYAEDFDW